MFDLIKSWRSWIKLIFLALALVGFQNIFLAVLSPLFGNPPIPPFKTSPVLIVGCLFIVAIVQTLIIAYLIQNSKWSKIRLAASIFCLLFVNNTLLNNLEIIFFNQAVKMSLKFVFLSVTTDLLNIALYAALAVWLFGKFKPTSPVADQATNYSFRLPVILLLLLLAYPLLYFSFGMGIWLFPFMLEYYADFIKHDIPTFYLYAWQVFRGGIWLAIAILMLFQLKGSWKQTAVYLGIAFALLMNIVLIIPNPFMPGEVRLYHFIEISITNFIWGWLIVWAGNHFSKPSL